MIQVTGGTTSTVMKRDSTSLPKGSYSSGTERRRARTAKRKDPPPVCSGHWINSASQPVICERSRQQDKVAAHKLQAAKRRKTANDTLNAAIASTAERLTTPAHLPPAAARMEALRRRIPQRAAGAASDVHEGS